ncbi:DUF2637 domain-containing protein [Streptomyces sp. NPDC008222]|uniref:DUF2637 domain-containing protein n=1 Tax=Streptomyces sp. NPDC008222 TaxID=3364820 RepID=UPI0036EF0CDB
MTTTPAGNEPNRPHQDGTLAPTAPGTAPQPMNRTQKTLTGVVVGAVLVIATLGFIGSYSAVTRLAAQKGFGEFAHAFPIAVDTGIIAFLALDLLLTWRRIAFPLLRYTAWGLTAATIAFNAVAAWPDPVGSSMHGVIPILFVIAVEAARHAIGRIADITADKHLEGPNPSRWFLNPVGTFVLWRRQRLWQIRTWDEVLGLERERRIYIGQLRQKHGRTWRRKATAEQLLVLWLATKNGMSITDAIDLPAREEAKRRDEEARIAREAQQAEDERRRQDLTYQQEQQRLEDERARQAEADRLEQERRALELENQRREAARQQQIADAEAKARLEEIARQQTAAAAEAERRRQQEQLAHAKAVTAEQERAAAAARQRRENEEAAARAAADKEAANRRAAEIVQRATSASPAPASRATSPASASRTATSQPANAATNPVASRHAESASATSANGASPAATSPVPASASTNQSAATNASGVAIDEVVEVYTLLKERNGKAPSDRELGDALNVSRSRAQQLRTAAIEAGHTELAKPLRIAS